MKKQIVQFLLGILYIGIVTALLLSQVIAIGEQTKRLMTVVEILLLVIPLVVILGLYIQVKNRPEKRMIMKPLKIAMGRQSMTL